MIKIGIDLATRKTGIVSLRDDKLDYSYTLKLERFSARDMKQNVMLIESKCENIKLLSARNDVKIFIELSKYGNATTEMFSFYAGVFYSRLKIFADVYFVEPRVWQREMLKDNGITIKLTGNGSKNSKRIQTFIKDGIAIDNTSGKVIKNISRENVLRITGKSTIDLTEDECDAFNLAYYGDRCKILWDKKEKK